jgi:hypothetical protein
MIRLRQAKVTWLVALPVATASWLAAHCLAYVLVPPGGGEAMHHHMESGEHAYFGAIALPVLLAAGLTVLAAGLTISVHDGLHGDPRRARPPALVFALLPPLGFVVQEHLEQLIATGSVPLQLAAEPTFMAGLALQLPFALGALLLSHAIYSIGYGLGVLVAAALPAARPVVRFGAQSVRRTPLALAPAPAVLAPGRGPRAPPSLACS